MTIPAAERPAADVGVPFSFVSEFAPAGDQPRAITELLDGVRGARAAGDYFWPAAEPVAYSPTEDRA